jgi:hypothetical protein
MDPTRRKLITLGGITILLIAIVGIGLAATNRSNKTSKTTQLPDIKMGIRGTITIGPQCPVQKKEEKPDKCADKPHEATVIVQTLDGSKEITRFSSNSNGQFTVELEPGTYRLVPQPERLTPPYAPPQTVIVEKDKVTDIKIVYDSGIR